jgi:CRP-like cAMP-binding protein
MALYDNPSLYRAEKNRDISITENPFAHLADRRKKVFSDLPPPRLYPPGTELFKQGSRLQEVYCIDQGLIKIVMPNRSGRAVIAGLRFLGWILGGAHIMLDKPSLVTAVSQTSSILQKSCDISTVSHLPITRSRLLRTILRHFVRKSKKFRPG